MSKKSEFILEYNTYCGIFRSNLPTATNIEEARKESYDLICKLSGDYLFPYRIFKVADQTHWKNERKKNPHGAKYVETES